MLPQNQPNLPAFLPCEGSQMEPIQHSSADTQFDFDISVYLAWYQETSSPNEQPKELETLEHETFQENEQEPV